MTREAVVLHFPGDPEKLRPKYAEGLRRFAEARPDVRPDVIFTGRSEESPQALVVVLLWPEGTSHEILGHFLLPALRDLGLERPAAEHLTVSALGWDACTRP
jgi:hypothetical protein